jgi:hypothetical protein
MPPSCNLPASITTCCGAGLKFEFGIPGYGVSWPRTAWGQPPSAVQSSEARPGFSDAGETIAKLRSAGPRGPAVLTRVSACMAFRKPVQNQFPVLSSRFSVCSPFVRLAVVPPATMPCLIDRKNFWGHKNVSLLWC